MLSNQLQIVSQTIHRLHNTWQFLWQHPLLVNKHIPKTPEITADAPFMQERMLINRCMHAQPIIHTGFSLSDWPV